MTTGTMTKVEGWTTEPAKGPDGTTLPSNLKAFDVLLHGRPVGTLRFAMRSRKAGGPAWRGALTGIGAHGTDLVRHDWNQETVLDWMRSALTARLDG